MSRYPKRLCRGVFLQLFTKRFFRCKRFNVEVSLKVLKAFEQSCPKVLVKKCDTLRVIATQESFKSTSLAKWHFLSPPPPSLYYIFLRLLLPPVSFTKSDKLLHETRRVFLIYSCVCILHLKGNRNIRCTDNLLMWFYCCPL